MTSRIAIFWVAALVCISILSPVLALSSERGQTQAQETGQVGFIKEFNTGDIAVAKSRAIHRAIEQEERERWKQVTFGQDDWDVLYYKIDLFFDLTDHPGELEGCVTDTIKSLVDGLTQVSLDFKKGDDLHVDAVGVNDQPVMYNIDLVHDLIHVYLDRSYDAYEEFTVTVCYHGTPIQFDDDYPLFLDGCKFYQHGLLPNHAVATSCEPYLSRTWWPCKDVPGDKANSIDIILSHSDDYIAATNGKLENTVYAPGGVIKTYWHHSYPISTYLVGLGITNYQTIDTFWVSDESDTLPISFYALPLNYGSVASNYPTVVSIMDHFVDLYGLYPFMEPSYGIEKYGILQYRAFYGMMEHQTISSSNNQKYDERTLAHELAHQWWGDMITCASWHDIWWQEGLATYSEIRWYESEYGWERAMDSLDTKRVNIPYQGNIYADCISTADSIFDGENFFLVYDKAAWFFHMLRHWAGDTTFDSILQETRDTYAYATINYEMFKEIVLDVTEDDRLEYFFDEWIHMHGWPKYEYSDLPLDDSILLVHLEQAQDGQGVPDSFHMPIDIIVTAVGGDVDTITVFNDQRKQDYVLYPSLSGAINGAYINEDWLLAEVTDTCRLFGQPLVIGFDCDYYEDTVYFGCDASASITLYSGSLPPGLNLDQSTGNAAIISGTATAMGKYNFTLKAQVYEGLACSGDYEIIIGGIGDANGSGGIDIDDVQYLINFIFSGGSAPTPYPIASGDANCSCGVDMDDVVYLIAFIFNGGPPPCSCRDWISLCGALH